MISHLSVPVSKIANIILVSFFFISLISAARIPDEGYDANGFYESQSLYIKFNRALEKLEHEPKWVPNWPNPSIKMGQVSGVALDNSGRLLVFHRASNTWDGSTFNDRNVYNAIGDPPIPEPTIMLINDTGELVDKWGQHLFYIPHGITVDNVGNVWVTDVALHQVFKFKPDQRDKPIMILGEKFVPGEDDIHFCKPSAVAVLSSGEFFVADGYCNTRIIKFAPDGTRILQWGRHKVSKRASRAPDGKRHAIQNLFGFVLRSSLRDSRSSISIPGHGDSPFVLRVPHALALAEDRGAVCVADRERGRAACFRADNGSYVASYSSWLIGARLFSIAYSSARGGRLYVVNGPVGGAPVRGYVLDYDSGRMVGTFAPPDGFANPHDVAVTADGAKVYVPELSPHRVCKFVVDANAEAAPDDVEAEADAKYDPDAKHDANATDARRAKPTATVEMSSTGMVQGALGGLSGALGAALGATGAALLALGAVALLRARNRGRKCPARRRWEYGRGEFKLRRLLDRRRFTRVHSDDSEDEPAPMLPQQPPANA